MEKAFSDEVADAIKLSYEAGSSLRELAKIYGVSRTTIKFTVERAGGKMRAPIPTATKFPTELYSVARGKYEAGKTLRQIADEFNVDSLTIRRAVISAGGTIRSQGRRPGVPQAKQRGLLSWLYSEGT